MKKIIITTGGTGGHIFPALAVAEELKSQSPDVEILFIGGEYGMEKTLVTQGGLDFISLPVRGFLGKGFKAITSIGLLMASITKALKIIKKFNPDAIAGFGGYASFPAMLAGLMQKKPCILHEQNAIAGASNKILSKLGAKVCVTLDKTKGFKKIEAVTGNPVRSGMANIKSRKYGGSKHLLIVGGSQGAHALNNFMSENISFFHSHSIEILHQCGRADEEELKKTYQGYSSSQIRVMPFIKDMAGAYEWADLILCRAGASTIAEICMTGTPAIFVPFPAAIHDHQTYNAQILTDAGGALLISEPNLKTKHTLELILDLLNSPDKLQKMSISLHKLAKPEAAAQIAEVIKSVTRKNEA